MNPVTTILSLYRRPQYLAEQVAAVRAQTVPSQEIWLWINNSPEVGNMVLSVLEEHKFDRVVANSCNWGVYGRFALALMAVTPYICVFDDDTIPGPKWYENCIKSIGEKPGLMGTAGIICESTDHSKQTRVGWPSHNREITQVDLVGHSWFFPRSILPAMWLEMPPTYANSEDLHFSYCLQKQGIDTFCPPHPADKPEMWGSLRSHYGADGVGMSNARGKQKEVYDQERCSAITYALSKGWKTIRDLS